MTPQQWQRSEFADAPTDQLPVVLPEQRVTSDPRSIPLDPPARRGLGMKLVVWVLVALLALAGLVSLVGLPGGSTPDPSAPTPTQSAPPAGQSG